MASPTSTISSLSSSERFGLDNSSKAAILVYNRSDGIVVPSSQQDLCKVLDADRTLRCSKLPIPWGNSHIEVHHGDLFPADQRSRFSHLPNMKLSLSSINLPRSVYWKRLLGQFRELYIVSPETTPTSSPENSQWTSRNPTFGSRGMGQGRDSVERRPGEEDNKLSAQHEEEAKRPVTS